jgi:3-oxoadipate enol-lactonase
VDPVDVRVSDGTRIRCLVAGDPTAPAMVLLHGLGEQAAGWEPVAPRLAETFRVLALDLRGHGASDRPGVYSYELMRDDVIGVLDALELPEVVLVGHSMGGVVAYLVAAARPERIARLVVEDAPMPFARRAVVRERPPGELPFDWPVVPAIAAQTDDPHRRWWPLLRDLVAPVLLVAGGPTSTIPQEELDEVARLVPDCTLVTIPAGHHVHTNEPEAFTRAVLDWLGR